MLGNRKKITKANLVKMSLFYLKKNGNKRKRRALDAE